MNLNEIIHINIKNCSCGREHVSNLCDVKVGAGAIYSITDALSALSAKKPFIISDLNTFEVAGKLCCDILDSKNIPYVSYTIPMSAPKPNEESVGSVAMHFDLSCDALIGVGSGVINDISKIIAAISGKPYIIIATAPSVDGYASATSSMDRDGLKISINSKCADFIIGDTDILKNAPMKMLLAGLGDILAKYTSICEWRIGNLVTGEYYCERVAELIRYSVKRCVENADSLLKRDKTAVKEVFEALVISGVAMNISGVSRPASGVEHYFSHLWDMRSLEFNAPCELHGLQCASGFLIAERIYERLKTITPNQVKALEYKKNFDVEKHNASLKNFLGNGADTMIALAERENRYDTELHRQRLEKIINNWDKIIDIINAELLPLKEAEELFAKLGLPFVPTELSFSREELITAFKTTKDIRNKYILSSLLWDIGELDNEYLLGAI